MPDEGASTTQEAQEAAQTPGDAGGTDPQGTEPKTFDAEYVRQLRAEAAKHRKEAQEAKARAQEYEDAQKSELEKAQTKAQKLEAEKQAAEAKLLRFEVATEKNVPAKLVPLLTATTREELEAQAALILENAKTEPTPDFDGGAREPAPAPKSPDQAHNQLVTELFGIRSE